MRPQRRREELVASHSFVRGDTTESSVELAGPLGQKRGPHLKEAIRKTGFENASGDCWKGPMKAEVCLLPALLLAGLKGPERLGRFGAEFYSPLSAIYFDKPGVRLPIRFISKRSGTSRPFTAKFACRSALSQVSQGAIPPFPSGR